MNVLYFSGSHNLSCIRNHLESWLNQLLFRIFDSGSWRWGLKICTPDIFLGVPAAACLRTISGKYMPTPQRYMKLLSSLFFFSIHFYFSGTMFGPLFNRNHAAIRRKSEYHTHVYSPGFFRISRTPGPTFPCFLVYLHSHCGGDFRHDLNHQGQFKTPHGHVRFP